jgi:hypothetical protein
VRMVLSGYVERMTLSLPEHLMPLSPLPINRDLSFLAGQMGPFDMPISGSRLDVKCLVGKTSK